MNPALGSAPPSWLVSLLQDGLLERRDTDGRFLGEQAAIPWSPAPGELRRCPYSGERLDGKMNVHAWAQVVRYWPDVLALLRGATGSHAASAYRATCRLRWAPLWAPDPVPAATAAAYKTTLGLTRPLSAWLLRTPGAAAQPLDGLLAEDVLGVLEREGWLLGKRHVCSAPPDHIRTAWAALGDPLPSGRSWAREDAAMDCVVGAWALLGAARLTLRDGRIEEVPDWDNAPKPHMPAVLHLLACNGPTALVREVPFFVPEWALRVCAEPSDRVADAVREATEALSADKPFARLDAAWARLRASVIEGVAGAQA